MSSGPYAKGIATIRHATTGQTFEIEADELDWQCVDTDDRQMGTESHYEAAIEHPALGELTWGVWEYPEGVENMTETKVGQHKVVADFDYGLAHTKDSNEDE